MLKIEVQSTKIPVQVGIYQFEFDMADDSIQKFYKKTKELQQKYADIQKNAQKLENGFNNLDSIKSSLKDCLDSIFSEKAFDKLYELAPSTIMLLRCYFEVVSYIGNEIEKRTDI